MTKLISPFYFTGIRLHVFSPKYKWQTISYKIAQNNSLNISNSTFPLQVEYKKFPHSLLAHFIPSYISNKTWEESFHHFAISRSGHLQERVEALEWLQTTPKWSYLRAWKPLRSALINFYFENNFFQFKFHPYELVAVLLCSNRYTNYKSFFKSKNYIRFL